MRGYVLKIAYKGTSYCGWQVQPGKPTVQALVQAACERVFGVKTSITGCSRTDSGVHARGFIALAAGALPEIPINSLPLAINTCLPPDIAVLEAQAAAEGFHPRYDAKGKEYLYYINNSRIRDPFTEETAWQFPRRIDEALAGELCGQFVGKKDFASFMAAGSKITDTVRTVFDFSVERKENTLIFRVSADGFLYNMVRIMVGTVAEKACGTALPNISEIIESRDRSKAGITAPAKGLVLNEVYY